MDLLQTKWAQLSAKVSELPLNKDQCACGTPIKAGAQIVAWLMLFVSLGMLALFYILNSAGGSFRVYGYIIFAFHIVSLAVTITLLFALIKNRVQLMLLFIWFHTPFACFFTIHTILEVLVTLFAILHHHVTEERLMTPYNMFLRLNIYDTFAHKEHALFISLFMLTMRVITWLSHVYILSIVWRAYKLGEQNIKSYNSFVNPSNFATHSSQIALNIEHENEVNEHNDKNMPYKS